MIGNRLRMLREARNMPMKAVAEDLQMPYTTYRNYENSRCEPNLEVLIKFALYYSISIDWLLGYTPPNKNNPPPDKWEAMRERLELLDTKALEELDSFMDFLIWKYKDNH